MVATVLPLALVVGLSPIPIMPAMLLLMTSRGRANGLAYLAAWTVALALVAAAAVWVGRLADPAPATEAGIGWVQVVTGAVFLALAVAKWVRRPRTGDAKEPPGWMTALDSYSPGQSARLGALLAAANPKNLAMALAAGAEIAVLTTGAASTAIGLLGFVMVGSVGVATPVLAHLGLGDRAAPALERGRRWLDRNSTALSVGVLTALGAALLVKGLSITA